MDIKDLGVVTDSQPILVSGVYRSGTTFLAALLGAHPKLRSSSSTIKFIRFCLGKYGDMTDSENRRVLVEDSRRRVNKRWELDMDAEAIISKANFSSEPSYALMYDLMMKDMLCSASPDIESRWVEKLAVQWSGIPVFLDMFPNGRVVHIIRDPRDVTASYKHMTFEEGNTYIDAAFNCRDSMQSMMQLDSHYSDRVMVVRGEDLAESPEKSVSDLCEFLDLDYSEQMLDVNCLNTAGEEWSNNTSFGEQFVKWPQLTSRWKDKLSKVEVMLVEMITQPYFSAYGYRSSGYFPTKSDWNTMYEVFDDEFLQERFSRWLTSGLGAEGYRTDPYDHEMKIVFPERFTSLINRDKKV